MCVQARCFLREEWTELECEEKLFECAQTVQTGLPLTAILNAANTWFQPERGACGQQSVETEAQSE